MTDTDRLRELVIEASKQGRLKPFAASLADPADLALLEEIVSELADSAPAVPGPLAAYHDRPRAFARDLIAWPEGKGLAPYQAAILDELQAFGREAVRGPHALGKTSVASLALLWFALTREDAGEDWKAPTTASSWLQLTHYLWPEVHKWSRLLRWEEMDRAPFTRTELMQLSLKLRHGEAFSASPSDAALIEGAHATQLMFIYDEAKTIPPALWDAVEGAFAGAGADTGAGAFALAISTPGEPNGRFFEIHRRAAGTEDWHTRHVSMAEAVAAGRMSADWAEQRARQWGHSTAVYQNRVLGEFASSDTDGVIPLGWVEAANQRWRERFDGGFVPPGPLEVLGVDCSGSGADRTVLARRYDDVVGPLERPRKASSAAGDSTGLEEMATAGRIVALLEANDGARAVIDAGGLGSGVVGRVREKIDAQRVLAFLAGGRSNRKDRNGEFGFADARAAAWWSLREQLDPEFGATLCLPPDDDLTGDLTAPHWREQSGGKIRVESKDDLRKRLGRSTDSGDAVVQACGWTPPVTASATAARARIPTMT